MRAWSIVLAFAFSLATAVALAASPAPAGDVVVVNPSDFHWKPKDALPPGATGAVVRGDPSKGDYDFFARFPAGFTVPMHTHTNDCVVIMTQGSMVIGRADKPDAVIDEGGLFVLPAELYYTAHCEKECAFLVHGAKPFDIRYARKEDDPRIKRK